MKRNLIFLLAALLLLPVAAQAKPKKKTYNNSPEQVFLAMLRTARERHVVTYVDEKQMMVSFQTGRSFWSNGFVCNASVEPEGSDKATLVINVQNKQGLSMGAGDRMADKFFDQVAEELAGDVSQKSAVKPPEKPIEVAPPKATPTEATIAKPAVAPELQKGNVNVQADPAAADIFVDGVFVGNAPAKLKLDPGKHTIKVSARSRKDWSRDLNVLAGSEVNLTANLEPQ